MLVFMPLSCVKVHHSLLKNSAWLRTRAAQLTWQAAERAAHQSAGPSG